MIHRDLKPASVRITPEGVVKLIDFGLAKPILLEASERGAPSPSSDSFLLTAEGMILGTPTYMSPEQARGKPVDRRTDLWALGCLLYECLTARRAFHAESIPDVLAAVVSEEPDWDRLPALPPRALELLRRLLTKEPRSRLRDAGEARVQLELAAREPTVRKAEAPRRGVLPLVLGGAIGLGGILVGFGARGEPARSAIPVAGATAPALELCVPVHQVEEQDALRLVKISPDATRVGWIDAAGLHVRGHADPEPRTLVEAADVSAFAWSPDSAEVAYLAGGSIWHLSAESGVPTRIPRFDGWLFSNLEWTADGRIAYLTESVLASITPDGETGTLFDLGGPDLAHIDHFALLRGGEAVALVPHYDARDRITIELVHGGRREEITELPAEPGELFLAPDGTLCWEVGDKLWGVPISPSDLEVLGAPRVVAEPWDRMFTSFAENGTLAFLQPEGEVSFELVSVDRRDGTATQLGGRFPNVWGPGDFSPDGSHFAFCVVSGKHCEVWLHDFERGTHSVLIEREDGAALARYLPDGRLGVTPLFPMQGTHVYSARGKGEPESTESWILGGLPEGELRVVARSPDAALGKAPTYLEGDDQAPGGVVLLDGEHGEVILEVSRDGEWMLYLSSRTGRPEAYLSRFPPDDDEWTISVEGADNAWFSAEGREVLYLHERGIYRVGLGEDGSPLPGAPEHQLDVPGDLITIDYDGRQRFVGVRRTLRGPVVYDTRGLSLD